MEQPIVYVGLNLQMDTIARHLPRHASEESCVALQGLKHAGAQAMPSSAPRAISLHFWHGRSGQRRPSASEFARGVVRAPVRGGCHGRASPIIPALVGDLSPKSNSMPSAAALRSISWSMAEPAPRWRQSSAIDMPNSPMRSAQERYRASPTTVRERYCRSHEEGQGVTAIGSQSTRKFRRRKFTCGAREPIGTRSRRKPSDIVLQSLAIAGADRKKNQPAGRYGRSRGPAPGN
jgi:hypothetical protein